jgi:hypothetical protein
MRILPTGIIIISALTLPFGLFPDSQPVKPRWTADFRAEIGIDSLERRYYRPTFKFSFPVPGTSSWRWNAGLTYDQRMNGRLQGALDFWLTTGLERRIGNNWSLEGAIRHMCRHATSLDNPVILDINEALGTVRFQRNGYTFGLGFGGYLGKTPGFRNLVVLSLSLPDFPAEGITLEAEVKWINFSDWLYEAGFSVALGRGAALFLRGVRTYRFPSAVYIGFRYDARDSGSGGGPLESFRFSAGAIPFDERYKLAASGVYRLEVFERGKSRLVADAGFSSPILNGDGFFAQFRPDRLVTNIRGEYEREVGRSLYVSWYAAYTVTMPTDKALPFAGALGTGLILKNQRDFERLERIFRYEVSAGWNFKFDQESAIRAGVNSAPGHNIRAGVDLDYRMNGRQEARIDARVFADFGRGVSVRPFVGVRNGPSLSGDGPAGRFKFVVGVGLYRWL